MMKNITNKCKKEELRIRQKKINTKKIEWIFFFEKSISDRIKTGLCDQNNDLCWFIYTPNYTSFEFVDRYAESLNGSPWWNWRKFVNEARTVFVCVQFWAWVNKSVIAGCRCPVIRLMASNKPILFLGLALSILYQPLPIACFLQRCFFSSVSSLLFYAILYLARTFHGLVYILVLVVSHRHIQICNALMSSQRMRYK